MEEYWFLAPMLRFAISSVSLKLSTTTFPYVVRAKQVGPAIDEENCLV